MSEAFEKEREINYMDKAVCRGDKTSITTSLTNDITNTKENIKSNNDILLNFGDNQEYSDYFENNVDFDLDSFKFGNSPKNIEPINFDESSNIPFLNFNDINNNSLKNPFSLGLNDDEKTIQPPSYEELTLIVKEEINEPKKDVKFYTKHKRMGRIPNNLENTIGDHTKYSIDNIERKVKVNFYESIIDYANELIKEFQSQNGNGTYCLLNDIDSKIKKQSSQKENLKLLENTVRDMLSANISSKFSTFSPNYNKKVIDKIYRDGKATEVISFLNTKVLLLYNQFINDDKKNGKFKTLEYHIESLKEKDDENYLKKFVLTAKNFEKNMRNKKPREKKKKKNI